MRPRLIATALLAKALLIVGLNSPCFAGEVVKWVDDKGKVHFSDREPTDKDIRIEKIDAKEAPKLGLTDEELREQKKRTLQYKFDVNSKRSEQAKKNKAKSIKPKQEEAAPQLSAEVQRAACRQVYKTNTKKRVECFNKIQ